MNAHTPIAERIASLAARLAPLIGKLGSPHDGEVVAAARAIGRQLERNGPGWNDLGQALAAEPVVRVVREPEPEPETDDWLAVAEFCDCRAEMLTEREADFIVVMRRVLRRPGAQPTPKQAAWLRGIFDRLKETV